MISDDLLKILACPTCKSSLRYEDEKLWCDQCQVSYDIENGIPCLLPKDKPE